MTPEQKAALFALLKDLEPVAEGAATVFGGPLAGAAVTAAAQIGNQALGDMNAPVNPAAPAAAPQVVNTPIQAGSTGVGAAAVQPSVDQFAALQKQIADLTAAMAKQQAQLSSPLSSAAMGQGVHVDAVPGVGVQPVVPDPKTHPVLLAAGRAPMVPTAPQATNRDLDPASCTLGDIIAAVNALHSKVDALVEASGLGGSAAMAGHA